RLAELAQLRGDPDAARESLKKALGADPASAAAAAMLDDLLLDQGEHAERIAQLERRAEDGEAPARALALWHAGQIAAEHLDDFSKSAALHLTAAELSPDKAAVLRELYGAALRHGAMESAHEAVRALIDTTSDPEERGALLRDLYELT